MTIKNSFLPYLSLVVLFASMGNAQARVESLFLERVVTDGRDNFYEVAIKCNKDNEKRKILRETSLQTPWCTRGSNSICNDDKYKLARQLCAETDTEQTPSPSQLVDNQEIKPAQISAVIENQSSAINVKELRAELLLIEEQRILIEQRRIELSMRELELKRSSLVVSQP
ncbi:hypothetical protein [Arenicella xantha]|uniref:Secreted protein n=1 Tax=Arenicella xantha TaxID=644221 RepID=A0A395JLU5_9GAMM|nr:hypothetical protein [Arenicella xantha]RBP51681.1 hypothetical protein DFR28_1021113 [Arenicella xantha]